MAGVRRDRWRFQESGCARAGGGARAAFVFWMDVAIELVCALGSVDVFEMGALLEMAGAQDLVGYLEPVAMPC